MADDVAPGLRPRSASSSDVARGEARRERRVVVVGAQRVAGFGPGGEHVPDVGARVAERADLPVEHRADVAAGVDDAVAEAEVAVHDRALGLLRDARPRAASCDTVDGRDVAGLRCLELRVPALELATHELVAPGEVAEPDRVDVDRVQGDERVDQRLGPRARARPRRAPLGGGGVVQDDAVDVGHHVERRADHVGVVAGRQRLRDGHRRRPERGDDAVLAAHVVRGREHAVQRWAAHHELVSVGIGHVRGDVRLAAGDELGA